MPSFAWMNYKLLESFQRKALLDLQTHCEIDIVAEDTWLFWNRRQGSKHELETDLELFMNKLSFLRIKFTHKPHFKIDLILASSCDYAMILQMKMLYIIDFCRCCFWPGEWFTRISNLSNWRGDLYQVGEHITYLSIRMPKVNHFCCSDAYSPYLVFEKKIFVEITLIV